MSIVPDSASQLDLPNDQSASGRSFGGEELELLREVLNSGTLTSTKGVQVKRLEEQFAEQFDAPAAYACSSGTAAIHAAIAAIDPEPGEEIITSPITDMGAIAPILYQGAIPVFADVCPRSGNLTAETIAERITPRTRAVILTHLFGNPADAAAIALQTAAQGIVLIEDCAQAYGARLAGRPVGTFGEFACFSLQQGKHITCGEGGLVVCREERFARRTRLFINKGWGYGDAQPDHTFLALNYRMSELQGAVARAQLAKLPALLERRRAAAEHLERALAGVESLEFAAALPRAEPSYWRIHLRVPAASRLLDALAVDLRAQGVPAAPRYIQKPAFDCGVFRDQRTFGRSRYPLSLAKPSAVDYRRERFPGAYQMLAETLVLSWNENMSPAHAEDLARRIRSAVARQ